MVRVRIRRLNSKLLPNPKRVIAKLFHTGEVTFPDGHRSNSIVERVLRLPPQIVAEALKNIPRRYANRHRDLEKHFIDHYKTAAQHIFADCRVTPERRRLIGAYFTREYSFEAAALCNPSIVPAMSQERLKTGQLRFIMSLRAIGEGHISSIEFRVGTIDKDGNVKVERTPKHAETGHRRSPIYDKDVFSCKLKELQLGKRNKVVSLILKELDARFTKQDLEAAIGALDEKGVARSIAFETAKILHWLAESNYTLTFPKDTKISERILFPAGPTESRGMEDARFVRFENSGRGPMYYATYTAYDGFEILPQLIQTKDFRSFRIATLSGKCAQNKGMALFPRKINGHYAMLSRIDREGIQLMMSKHIRVWDESTRLRTPKMTWELIQMGNCGSPIETEHGWLVLTHGVGPLREYSLSAILLDLHDPSRVIGNLPEPLLIPNKAERDGYVPNVLYSCGALRHGDTLLIPYGFSDIGTAFATVSIRELISALAA